MKKVDNKFKAVCLYFAPYLGAVLCIALYGIIGYFVKSSLYGGRETESELFVTLLTYLPISVAFVITAICIAKAIRKRYDLSVIGIQPTEKKETNGRFSFLIVIIVMLCAFVSVGFTSSTSFVEKKQVGGSPSYYIIETGFLGMTRTETVLSPSMDMEYDGEKFVIKLSNGKKYTVKKNTEAGKIVSELFFG